jgi:hypothetical protein
VGNLRSIGASTYELRNALMADLSLSPVKIPTRSLPNLKDAR